MVIVQTVMYDDPELQKKLKVMFKNGSLRPVIGSGFTRGNQALRGDVPSGVDMIEEMTTQLLTIPKFANDGDYMSRMKFSELSRLYENSIDIRVRHNYFESYFTDVNISPLQKRFLEIDWRYIFTLNIDDAIERNSDYQPILPNKELNEDYIKDKKLVYKLHGDVHDVLTYKKHNTDQMIFSNNAYLRSLQTNLSLLDILRSSILSLNILYIGCSLEDEIDLLSVTLKTKTQNDLTESQTQLKQNFYVTQNTPSGIQEDILENFGITDIILVDDYHKFYDLLYKLYIDSTKLDSTNLDEFLVTHIVKEGKDKDKNLSYLSGETPGEFSKNHIKVPFFFSERSIVSDVVKEMPRKNLQFLYGHRVSGKTYCLVEIINRIKNKNVFYFPSKYTLADDILEEILKYQEAVFLFDTETLTTAQITYFKENLSVIKESDLNLIFAINSSDKDIISIVTELDKKEIGLYKVDHKLSKEEVEPLNNLLSIVNIPNFDRKNSLLDNIYWIYNTFNNNGKGIKLLPKLDELTTSELVLFIALATKSKLSAHSITTLELIEDIGIIHQKVNPAIQFVYTDHFEKENFSGYKLLPNANFWILKTLGNYAENRRNHIKIAEAYKNIVGLYKRKLPNDREFSNAVMDYVKFDTINDIFPVKNHGVSPLINEIYTHLNDYMAQNPHYFHQKAKAKFWMNRKDLTELRNALQLAVKAKRDLEISQNIHNERVKKSLSHMQFTIATIQGRIAKLLRYEDQIELSKAIHEYDSAFGYKENQNYLTQFKERKNRYDKADFFSLIQYSVKNRVNLTKNDSAKVAILMQTFPEKPGK
ncbi:SIR2 family protein [Rossellomorea marisflavi]|uniref:SIR2 family protein n=1 Tax=Rossellomorea marisflavi TaxID=189381 RepID=UPI003457726E